MSALDDLKTRLNYMGGNAEGRFQKSKLISLKRALLYSYQGCPIELENGLQFRALMNPGNIKEAKDDKILSVPYNDVCLNNPSKEDIPMKVGDTFRWVDTDTHWIILYEYPEEDSYYRAEVRRCQYEEEIGGEKHWIYLRGPVETAIDWDLKEEMGRAWNNLNYSLVMYVTNTDATRAALHRFSFVKLLGNRYQVQAVDSITAPGLIKVALREYYNNTIEEEIEKLPAEEEKDIEGHAISGPAGIHLFDSAEYTIDGNVEGKWEIEQEKVYAKLLENNAQKASVLAVGGMNKKIQLLYLFNDEIIDKIEISILSI